MSYEMVENGGGERSSQNCYVNVGGSGFDCTGDVVVRMAVPNHPLSHFADDGEEVELYVTFPDDVSGVPYRNRNSEIDNELAYEVDLAGQRKTLEPLITFAAEHCRMFKATVTLTSSQNLQPGQPVPFNLQYEKTGDPEVKEITEVTEPNMPVLYQPVYKKLQERDGSLIEQILECDKKGGDAKAFATEVSSAGSRNLHESESLLKHGYKRPSTPKQVAEDDFFLYYTRQACRPFFESKNPVIKFIRELMVTPLTNFTGLSLYYQLYLVEIFHVKFYTKLGHYLCMPMIVLFMATWCAQWRYTGSYRIEDVSVFIVNGTLIFVSILQAWYLLWGCLYKMYHFGFFMVWPLFLIYMLANMLFQMIVISSDLTVADVQKIWGQNSSRWYDFITLAHFGVKWYLNPLLWALVFCALQAVSHIWEDKLPPRVSQTAHWMDMTTILKRNGYVHFALIAISQTIFGTVNEFFASPRLLPLLMLRICYNLGYKEKQWIKFRTLVDECLKFGDPAIDYIGRGGAQWPEEFNRCEPESSKEKPHATKCRHSKGKKQHLKDPNNEKSLKEKLHAIEGRLSKEKKQHLNDPNFLENESKFTKELQYYVLLRYRITKYRIQVEAYGPFTPKDSGNLELDEQRMMNDFQENPAFIVFLKEARSHFAEMEYQFVQECKLNRVLP